MKTIHLGRIIGGAELRLPIDTITLSLAILAAKGAGKSYTAAVFEEETLGLGVPVVIIDPAGVHWGIKSSADGRGEGHRVVIFGGDHADLPLEVDAGAILAASIVENRFSAIIDMRHFSKGQINRFLASFLSTLYLKNKEPLHLICDEADAYAPQKSYPDNARTLGAMEDIVRRGRSRGIGSTLITQRPAAINKDVLTQCEVLIAMRMGHPRDINAIKEWIDVHGDEEKAEKMISSLPALPTGTAWVWAPTIDDIFAKVQIRRRTTFDSSATPKIGETKVQPKAAAKIDLAALGKEIAATAERAKENDPRELHTKISKLQGELSQAQAAAALQKKAIAAAPPKEVVVEKLIITDGDRKALIEMENLLDETKNIIRVFIDKLDQSAKTQTTKITPPYHQTMKPTSSVYMDLNATKPVPYRVGVQRSVEDGGPLSKCARAILTVLAQFGPSDRVRVATLAGYSVESGGYANALSQLRGLEFIEGTGQQPISITASGAAALGQYTRLPTGQALIAHWAGRLDKCAKMILEYVCSVHPEAKNREQIAAATGYSVESGGFANALSTLRGLELINRGTPIKASDNLFS